MPVKLGITTCSYDTYVFLRVSSDVHFRVPKAEREGYEPSDISIYKMEETA